MFFQQHADLFGWQERLKAFSAVSPWKPEALKHSAWPPDYKGVYMWRIQTLERLRADSVMMDAARAYYRTRPAEFIMHWMDTYNPRKKDNKWMPFVFFTRQLEFIDFLHELREHGESGLVEKCRDAGATWLACGYSIWSWLFIADDAIGWGSRKQELVDKIGDASSIFEKMRKIVERLPDIWTPHNFSPRKHATFMKFINPENSSSITGETGDAIGRGGRTALYFKDESQPLTAKILTPNGYKLMGDIDVGDVITGSDGGVQTVTHINEVGQCMTYTFGFSDGSKVQSTPNHIWEVDKVQGSRKRITLRTHEIAENYLYKSPGGQIQYRYRVPHHPIVQFAKQSKKLPLHPYLVGALLGDGSVKHVPKYSPSISTTDQEIVDSFNNLLPDGCELKFDSKCAYRIVDVRGRQGNKPDKKSRARQVVVKAGIAGHGSETKFIPDKYLKSTPSERLALLQGLMDTDGSASSSMTTFHTGSIQLVKDVQFLVHSLGGVASHRVTKDNREDRYLDMQILNIRLPDGVVPFRLTRKIERMVGRKNAVCRTITSIEKDETPSITRCITVSNADGLYLTDNMIITHNSAHYERPELIEAALGDNTNCQVDISSVNGLGNVFHRKREAGIDWVPDKEPIEAGFTRVFVIDWSHHPEKDQAWYDKRKAKAEREGMQHIFAQEVERNYSAAIQNTLIQYDWIQASVDAHLKIPYLRCAPSEIPNQWGAGLDLADEGIDRNALTLRQWIIWRDVQQWGERDVGVTTRRAINLTRHLKDLRIQYDVVGIGSTVKAEFNRLEEDPEINLNGVRLIPWNAGGKVIEPFNRIIEDDDQSLLNKDMFGNMKAQAWWHIRTRFYKTFKAVTEGVVYRPDELISLDGTMPLLMQLMKELAQPTRGQSTGLRTIVEKKPDGTKSPDLADSGVMAFFPMPESYGEAYTGLYAP